VALSELERIPISGCPRKGTAIIFDQQLNRTRNFILRGAKTRATVRYKRDGRSECANLISISIVTADCFLIRDATLRRYFASLFDFDGRDHRASRQSLRI